MVNPSFFLFFMKKYIKSLHSKKKKKKSNKLILIFMYKCDKIIATKGFMGLNIIIVKKTRYYESYSTLFYENG